MTRLSWYTSIAAQHATANAQRIRSTRSLDLKIRDTPRREVDATKLCRQSRTPTLCSDVIVCYATLVSVLWKQTFCGDNAPTSNLRKSSQRLQLQRTVVDLHDCSAGLCGGSYDVELVVCIADKRPNRLLWMECAVWTWLHYLMPPYTTNSAHDVNV